MNHHFLIALGLVLCAIGISGALFQFAMWNYRCGVRDGKKIGCLESEMAGPKPNPNDFFMRAKTYHVIARGHCYMCNRRPIDLRLVFNPFGNDQFMCEECGEDADSSYNEHL